jgi:hypothetical protein
MIQPVVSNQTSEMNQQHVISEHVTVEKTVEEILRELETTIANDS